MAASYIKPCRACRWDCLRCAALRGKVDDGSSSGLECAFAATHYVLAYLPTYLLPYLPTNLPTCLPTYLLTYLPTNLLPYILTYLPTSDHLPIYLPTYPPKCLPTNLHTFFLYELRQTCPTHCIYTYIHICIYIYRDSCISSHVAATVLTGCDQLP